LKRFDATTGAFTTFRHVATDPSSLSHDVVSRLLVDRKGRFWVATWNGLDRFDPATQRFVVYKTVAEDVPERFYNVVEDDDGSLWLGGAAGLSHFDPATGQFTVYSHVGTTLSDNAVTSVLVDHAGTVWASTENGLNRLDAARHTFVVYHAKDGLPSDAVSCLLEDTSGRLWMSTTRGLSRFDPATSVFRNYSIADGVPGGDLSGWDACFKSRTGAQRIVEHQADDALTERELDVLMSVAAGNSNKIVADKLSISEEPSRATCAAFCRSWAPMTARMP
jgi:ligand-binding sensor domain-containing protein